MEQFKNWLSYFFLVVTELAWLLMILGFHEVWTWIFAISALICCVLILTMFKKDYEDNRGY